MLPTPLSAASAVTVPTAAVAQLSVLPVVRTCTLTVEHLSVRPASRMSFQVNSPCGFTEPIALSLCQSVCLSFSLCKCVCVCVCVCACACGWMCVWMSFLTCHGCIDLG